GPDVSDDRLGIVDREDGVTSVAGDADAVAITAGGQRFSEVFARAIDPMQRADKGRRGVRNRVAAGAMQRLAEWLIEPDVVCEWRCIAFQRERALVEAL